MHPYIPQAQPYAYPQAAWSPRPSAPGSAVTALVLTILVLAGALLLSPLTILFSIGAASTVTEPDFGGTADLVAAMLVAFLPLGAPATLGAALAIYPRIRMPREMYPSSGVKTAATVFLVLHLLTLVLAVIFGVLPQVLVL